MSNSMIERTNWLVDWSQKMMLAVTEDLTPEQFSWRPGSEAPPIGWHLWHIARWADLVQATFPAEEQGPRRQIWEEEEFALRWELDPTQLGPCQGGEGMDHELAATIPEQIGQAAILDYSRRCFATFENLEGRWTQSELDRMRPSPYAFAINEDGRVVSDPTRETQLGDDLAWHMNHVSRHLGMIEALRGAQTMDGTATA